MQELSAQCKELYAEIMAALKQIGLDRLLNRQKEIEKVLNNPDIWQDTEHAQTLNKENAQLLKRTKPWTDLRGQINELNDLIDIADETMIDDLNKQLKEIRVAYNALHHELKFSDPYDTHNVIMNIYAGAGGTDAQDWAQMLMRMYVRWAEKNDLTVTVIEESSGEEAGIKSVMLEIVGTLAYGKLKSEHGVHRLVRLSPYNADNLRQTSFAKVDVLPEVDKPDKDIEIDDKDLRIDVYRSGGKGGQSVNTTDSAVRITHIPTGITVAIQNERSQLQNKETALTILRSRLLQLKVEQHASQLADLKGPNQSAEWGNQIRSYVLHPYKQVKDLRTRYESSDPDAVLDGDIDGFINAYLDFMVAE